MTGRIRIRVGPVEVEYEGDEEFIREEFPKIITNVSRLVKTTGHELLAESGTLQEAARKNLEAIRAQVTETTAAIAQQLDVASGPELVKAAALNLMHSKHLESFNRDQLIEEMKSATEFFRNTYLKNLTAYLDELVKQGTLQKIAENTYRLSAKALRELETRIAYRP